MHFNKGGEQRLQDYPVDIIIASDVGRINPPRVFIKYFANYILQIYNFIKTLVTHQYFCKTKLVLQFVNTYFEIFIL